ncbi:33139_t:CDS:2, partial [Racocetra persica]
MSQHKIVSPHTRVKEYPEYLRVDNNAFFCKFCNVPLEWKCKSTTQNEPVFPLVYNHLEQLLAYLQSNRNSNSFSEELDNTIRQQK